MKARWLLRTLLGCALVAACDGDPAVPDSLKLQEVAVAELTFSNIGKPDMSASVIVASSLDELEQIRNGGGNPSNVLVFEAFSVGLLDHKDAAVEGRRYIHAMFLVRGIFSQATPLLDPPTVLVAIGSANTLAGTPYRTLLLEDQSSVTAQFAEQVHATGRARLQPDGTIAVDSVDVVEVLSSAEARQIDLAGITQVFNFGYTVLPSALNPADGIVTVSWSLPLHDVPSENPTTLSALIVAARAVP